MEGIGLLIFYGVLLLFMWGGFAICFKKNRRTHWALLLIAELVAIILAFRLARYYDALPISEGSLFPGLEHLAEVLYSMGATVVYAGMFGVTVACFVGKQWRGRRKKYKK